MKQSSTQDTIEKTIDLQATPERVWAALSDHKAFGEWFRAKIDDSFEVGKTVNAESTYEGCDGSVWEMRIVTMDKPSRFAFYWQDGRSGDDNRKPETLVEFKLEPIANGTHLHICESGFAAFSDTDRKAALQGNTEGWNFQAQNIKDYLERAQ